MGGKKNIEHRKLAAVQRGRVLCLLRLQMAVAGKPAKHTMPCGKNGNTQLSDRKW